MTRLPNCFARIFRSPRKSFRQPLLMQMLCVLPGIALERNVCAPVEDEKYIFMSINCEI